MALRDRTVNEFIDIVSSKKPAPGGGSVSALAGSLGGALTIMVGNLTVGRKKFQKLDDKERQKFDNSLTAINNLKEELTDLVDTDTEAFHQVMAAYKMPGESEDQRKARKEAIQIATRKAMDVPLKTANKCLEILRHQEVFAKHGNPNAISDVGVGTMMAFAGIKGAIYNVKVNLEGLDDKDYAGRVEQECERILREAHELKTKIQGLVDDRL